MSHLRHVAAAFLGSLALVLLPAPSHAVTPERWSADVDDTFVSQKLSALCGFEVVTHVQGKVRGVDFLDADGSYVRSLVVYPSLTYTFANAATGETVSSRSPDPEHITWGADGSLTLKATGLVMHFLLPGDGMTGQAGQLTVTVDAEGNGSEAGPVGLNEDYHAALCALLAS